MVRVHQPPGGQTHLNEDLPPKPLNVRVQQPPGGKTHFDDEVMPRQPNVRVLKPPGGGSSISFGDDEVSQVIKPKVAQQQQQPQEAPKNGTHEEPAANAETNGTKTPKDNATATKENNPSAATNGIANNGTMSNGSNGTPNSGSSTPNSSRLDTQTRLFGEETRHHHEVANRRVRDHQRSNIFSGDGEKLNTPKSGCLRNA